MTLVLQASEPWAITDAGMSYDGVHAIDRIWVGRDDSAPSDVVVYGEHPLNGGAFELRKTITVNGHKPVDLDALLLDVRNLGLNDIDVRTLMDAVMDACAEATPYPTHTIEELAAQWPDDAPLPNLVAGQAPAIGAVVAPVETAAQAVVRLLAQIRSIPRVGNLEDPPYPLMNRVDLGEVMRGGGTEPEMLLANRLVRGLPHLFYGAKACGKTMRVMRDVKDLLALGYVVVWIDREMDRKLMADLLVSLDVPDDVVSERFVYLDRPTLDKSPEALRDYLSLLMDVRPVLVVVDAAQGVLASAELNEDRSPDVNYWHARYLEPALLLGATTVMIDHTGYQGDRARGSSSKGQIARVEVLFETDGFDRDRVGTVKTTIAKNTPAAPLVDVTWWRMGGTPLVVEPDAMPPVPDGADPNATDERIVRDVENVLRENVPQDFSPNQMRGFVTGRGMAIDKALVWLANSDASQVCARRDGKGVRYWWSDPDLVPSHPSGLENHTPDDVGRGDDLVRDDMGRGGTGSDEWRVEKTKDGVGRRTSPGAHADGGRREWTLFEPDGTAHSVYVTKRDATAALKAMEF